MFSQKKRCIYANNQLADVICQLRFPEILSIGANLPVDFQDAIRDDFPKYAATKENTAPRITGTPGNLNIENAPPTINYQFTSADNIWRVNLTSKFISLACTQYKQWEDFAKMLDKPLANFIKIYKPAYFERVGLRYLNFFSRKELGLDEYRFSDLIAAPYLGLLADDEIPEHGTSRCSVDAEVPIKGGCRAKLHAGPGMVKRNGKTDQEIKYIFDQDLFMTGNIPVNYSAGALETLHSQAYPIFRDAITDILHNALEPQNL